MHSAGRCSGPPSARPPLEIAQIFRAHGEGYRQRHRLTPEQRAAMRAIESCRTAVLGGHLDLCPECGHQQPAYNSCRNRHCPKCQALTQARWIEKHRARILPVAYFHVVFTVPAQLRPLARLNRQRIFDALFAAAAATLQDLARDPRRLGATLGFTAVLHTWTRELVFHPHLHCVVTAGGLAPTRDHWVSRSSRFLFPVRVLGRLFRGKLLAALRRAHQREPFALPTAEPDAFDPLLDRSALRDWVVYAKAPFRGADHVYEYLGRYTHRVAISNRRIQAFDGEAVTFGVRPSAATHNAETMTLPLKTFIDRFLLHLLPQGFTRIRHYGFLAGQHRERNLATIRALLEASVPVKAEVEERGPDRCPICSVGELRRGRDVAPWALMGGELRNPHNASTGPPATGWALEQVLTLARAAAV